MHIKRIELQHSKILVEYDKIELLFGSLRVEKHDSAVVSLMHQISLTSFDFQIFSFLKSKNHKAVVSRIDSGVKSTKNIIEEVHFGL